MLRNRYNAEYQSIINNTIAKALEAHSRSMVFRCDLRFPDIETSAEYDSRVITRFFSSLKAKIRSDLKRKARAWGRGYPCVLNYVWVREYGDEHGRKHYHVLIFVNKDVYHALGDYRAGGHCLAAMVREAWSSATGLHHSDFGSLVHFGQRFFIDRNSPDLTYQIQKVEERASYLAKHVTKCYGDGGRSIGSSL